MASASPQKKRIRIQRDLEEESSETRDPLLPSDVQVEIIDNVSNLNIEESVQPVLPPTLPDTQPELETNALNQNGTWRSFFRQSLDYIPVIGTIKQGVEAHEAPTREERIHKMVECGLSFTVDALTLAMGPLFARPAGSLAVRLSARAGRQALFAFGLRQMMAGAVVGPVVGLLRRPITNALLKDLNSARSPQDLEPLVKDVVREIFEDSARGAVRGAAHGAIYEILVELGITTADAALDFCEEIAIIVWQQLGRDILQGQIDIPRFTNVVRMIFISVISRYASQRVSRRRRRSE